METVDILEIELVTEVAGVKSIDILYEEIQEEDQY